MDTTLDYSIRLEDKCGIIMWAPLEMTWTSANAPVLRILEWEDLGEVKQGIDPDDPFVLQEIYAVFHRAASAIMERQATEEHLPVGERMLLAYGVFPNGGEEPVRIFIEAKRVPVECLGEVPAWHKHEKMDREYQYRRVYYTIALGWSNDASEQQGRTRFRETQKLLIHPRDWKRTTDPAEDNLPEEERGAIPIGYHPAVQQAAQQALQEVRTAIERFGKAFRDVDDRIWEGLGREGVKYYFGYVDTGLRSTKGRLEFLLYADICYIDDWEVYDEEWRERREKY